MTRNRDAAPEPLAPSDDVSSPIEVRSAAAMKPARRIGIILGAAVAVLGIVGVAVWAATSSSRAQADRASDGPVYLWDTAAELSEEPGEQFGYSQTLNWSASPDEQLDPIVCPPESTGVWTFVSEAGLERSGLSGWKAYSASGFNPQPLVTGRREVLLPVAALDYQSDGARGDYEEIKGKGGRWSLGIACTSDQDHTITAAFYRTIEVQPGTGRFTADPVSR